MSDKRIVVDGEFVTMPIADAIKLLDLSGEALCLQWEEFSNYPSNEEILLIEHAHHALNQPIPDGLASTIAHGKQRIQHKLSS